MKQSIGCLFALLISFVITGAYAWDSQIIGKVKQIQIHGPTSSKRNVIVILQDVDRLCSLSTNYSTAYLNKVDAPDTYEVFISVLLTAKTTSSSVQLYTEIGPEGYRIGRVDLQ